MTLLFLLDHAVYKYIENFRNEFKGYRVYFKCFPGTNTKQLVYYYSISMLVDEKANTAIIHIGFNDITKRNYHTINPDELAKGIVNVGLTLWRISNSYFINSCKK